jgi:hypothetical protein
LQRAYHRRLILIVESLGNGKPQSSSPPVIGRSFVGYVGNVIIQIDVSQTLCSPPPNVVSVSAHPQLIERTGVIQFNLLADMDSLAHKPLSKSESLAVVPLNSIRPESGSGALVPGVPVALVDSFVSITPPPKLLPLQLIAAAKALSTLSRVVNALFLRESQQSLASVAGSGSSFSPPPHISYRDSVLTRVLQASLQGNLANCIGLFLDLRQSRSRWSSSDEAMASTALSCSNSVRVMSELQGAMATSSFLRSSDRKIPFTRDDLLKYIPELAQTSAILETAARDETPLIDSDSPLLALDTEMTSTATSPTLQSMFWDLFNSLQSDSSVSSAISDLLTLEQERQILLERLGGQRFEDGTIASDLLEPALDSQSPSSPMVPLEKDKSSSKSISLPSLKSVRSKRGLSSTASHELDTPAASLGVPDKFLSPLSPPRSAASKAKEMRPQQPRRQLSKSLIPHLPSPPKPSSLPTPGRRAHTATDDQQQSPILIQRSSKESALFHGTQSLDLLVSPRGSLQSDQPQSLLSTSSQMLPAVATHSSPPSPRSPFSQSHPCSPNSQARPQSPFLATDSPTKREKNYPRKAIGSRTASLPDSHLPSADKDLPQAPDSDQLFLKAVSRSNVASVKSYLHQGVDLSVRNSFGRYLPSPPPLPWTHRRR